MEYLPIFIRLKGADCLVVGGGEVALRKVHLLQRVGARITVAAPRVVPALRTLAEQGEIRHYASEYRTELVDGKRLVIAATNDRDVNRSVSADCQARHIPVNVVDDPELCSFVTPSIVDRSPVIVAISSAGAA